MRTIVLVLSLLGFGALGACSSSDSSAPQVSPYPNDFSLCEGNGVSSPSTCDYCGRDNYESCSVKNGRPESFACIGRDPSVIASFEKEHDCVPIDKGITPSSDNTFIVCCNKR